MEDNKQTQTQGQSQPQGWKNAVITPNDPAIVLYQFINVLNQRVAQLEDIVKMNYNGQTISVTEYIAIRTEEEFKKQQEQAKAQEQENKAE